MAVAGLFGAVRVGIDHDLVGSPVPKGGMHGVELHDLLVRPAEPAVNTAQVDRHGRHPALLPECQPPGARRRTDGASPTWTLLPVEARPILRVVLDEVVTHLTGDAVDEHQAPLGRWVVGGV